MKTRTGRAAAAVLVAIVALGAALRFRAVSYGLPAIFNPDEIPILSRALAFAKGDLNPHNFLYPTLYFYALFAWETLYFVVGRVAGIYHSVADFQNAFFVDPSRLVLVGRTLTATFGVASIVAVYDAGRRFFDRQVGHLWNSLPNIERHHGVDSRGGEKERDCGQRDEELAE